MSHTTTLDPKLLAEEIKNYTFAKIIPDTVRVLKTPDEIRREADLDILDPNGKFIEKKHSAKFRQDLLDAANKGNEFPLTLPGKVEIDEAKLRELEDHIRQCWTMQQIISFHSFLHGGKFTSTAGWECMHSGIVMQTSEEDWAFARMFERLYLSCYFYVGAASVLKAENAKYISGYAFSDEGDGQSVWDLTLVELRRKMPEELQERLKKATNPIEKERGDARNRQGGADRRVQELEKENAELIKRLCAATGAEVIA